jgi:DUF1680 family protein
MCLLPFKCCKVCSGNTGICLCCKGNDIYFNLYISNDAQIEAEQECEISQKADFPWNGNVEISLDPSEKEDSPCVLRIPGWARKRSFAPGASINSAIKNNEPVFACWSMVKT